MKTTKLAQLQANLNSSLSGRKAAVEAQVQKLQLWLAAQIDNCAEVGDTCIPYHYGQGWSPLLGLWLQYPGGTKEPISKLLQPYGELPAHFEALRKIEKEVRGARKWIEQLTAKQMIENRGFKKFAA